MVLFITALVGGCSEDNPIIVEENQWIDALLVICDPLCPSPGEMSVLTALVTGEGDWATYEWTVDGGTLQEEEGITVHWEAPQTAGLYEVRLVASLGASADTVRRTVMVRNFEMIDTGVEYSFQPYIRDNTLFFAGSNQNPASDNFFGFHIYRYEGPSNSLVMTGCDIGCSGLSESTFYPDVDNGTILGVSLTHTNLPLRQYAENIFLWDMAGIAAPVVITDEYIVKNNRANRNIFAQATDDLGIITWEHHTAGLLPDGTRDLFNIKFYNRNLDREILLTKSMDSTITIYGTIYRYYSNIKPLITPQEDRIIYFVDTTRTYEPCIIEIDGGLPDTLSRRALMVPDKNYGIFHEADVSVSERTFFDWCPQTYDILAFIDDGGILCFFYPYTESVDRFAALGQVTEFAWSPDGEQFAIVNDDGIGLGMTLSGEVTTVYTREKLTDDIIGITWSRDISSDPKLAFRLVRKGKTSIDSFSSLVIYSINDDDWYFALPRIELTQEMEVDYHLNRVLIEPDDTGMYVPVPTEDRSVIYHSYD